MDISQQDFFNEFKTDGYQIFDCMDDFEQLTAIQLFKSWEDEIPLDLRKYCNVIKDYFNGHQAFCWYIRCLPKVLKVFNEYWKDVPLVVSFERAQLYDCAIKKKKNCTSWACDVNYSKRGGVKAIVIVECCAGSGFCYIPGKRDEPSKKKFIDGKTDQSEIFVPLKPGQMIFYDAAIYSRFIFGVGRTVIQPVNYFPRNLVGPAILAKRVKMFLNNEACNHCCHKSHILKKGLHEEFNLKNETDLILDTMYINHEIRNSLI